MTRLGARAAAALVVAGGLVAGDLVAGGLLTGGFVAHAQTRAGDDAQARAIRDFSRRMTYEELRRRELAATLERVRVETEVERARAERESARQTLRALGGGDDDDLGVAPSSPSGGAAAAPAPPRAPPPGDVHLVWRRGDRAEIAIAVPDAPARRALVRDGDAVAGYGAAVMTPDGGVALRGRDGTLRRLDLYLEDVRANARARR